MLSQKRWIILFVLIGIACLAFFLMLQGMFSDIFSFKASHPPTGEIVNVVDVRFDDPSHFKDWKEYVFNKKSDYKVERDPNGEMALHASSRGGYSIVFKAVDIPLDARPILAWEWRAEKFPSKAKRQNLGAENENDFSIRICAIFAKNNPFITNIVHYIWDDYFPVGTQAPSPYSKNVRMLVVTSGKPASSKEWVTVKRDVASDYKQLFENAHFSDLKAIAIISNSDDTQSESEGYIKRIWIESAHAERIHKNKFRIPIDILDIGNLSHSLNSFRRFPISTYRAVVSGTVGQVEKITGILRKEFQIIPKPKWPAKTAQMPN